MAEKSQRATITEHEIMRVASRVILNEGYSVLSIRGICKELNLSIGCVTYHFPSKEHILEVVVKMLCSFQWDVITEAAGEGKTSLLAYCLELTTMAAACEENPAIKDFFLSTYISPLTLEIIRKSDIEKTRTVFGEFCPDWDDEKFTETENLVSGIELATLLTTKSSASLEMRITGGLNAIMTLYGVPEELRKTKLGKVLAMDYRSLSKTIIKNFLDYVEFVNAETYNALLKK